MKIETKVGLFVILSFLLFLWLFSFLQGFDSLFNEMYSLRAVITDGSGLKKKSKIKLLGVNIGYIENIIIKKDRIDIEFLVNKEINIPENSTISIKQTNLLGGKFLNIIPGNSNKYLLPNSIIDKIDVVSSIANTTNTVNDAFKNLDLLVNDFRNLIKEREKTSIKNILSNSDKSMKFILDILKENNKTISNIIRKTDLSLEKFLEISKNMNSLITKYNDIGKNINKDLPKILNETKNAISLINSLSYKLSQKLPSLIDNTNLLITENKPKVNKLFNSLDEFFIKGNSSMKKVDDYLSALDKTQINLEAYSSYLFDDGGYSKSNINISILPNKNKSYIFGLSSGPNFKLDNNIDRGYEGNKNNISSKFLLSLQYGYKVNNYTFRGGLINSQGGIGIDYISDNEKFKLSNSLYDFNSVNDVRGNQVNFTSTVRYKFFNFFNTYIGFNNLLNENTRNISLGVGVEFIDNDLKSLLGALSSSSIK